MDVSAISATYLHTYVHYYVVVKVKQYVIGTLMLGTSEKMSTITIICQI